MGTDKEVYRHVMDCPCPYRAAILQTPPKRAFLVLVNMKFGTAMHGPRRHQVGIAPIPNTPASARFETPCSACARRMHGGFSAIELMVVVAILGVLAALAAPSFIGSIERNTVNTLRNDLIAAIQLARVESIRRGMEVSLVRKTGCDAPLSATDDWSCGYELIVDSNTNGARDPGEEVLKSAVLPMGYGLSHTNQGSALRLNIWGQFQLVGNVFSFRPPHAENTLATTAVCISRAGRIRTVPGSTSCSS